MPQAPTTSIPGPQGVDAAWTGAASAGKASLQKEMMASGPRASLAGVPWVLDHGIDELTRLRGAEVYDRMLLDPKVAAAVDTLKQSAMAEGMHLSAAVEEVPDDLDIPEELRPKQADVDLAAEIHEFCEWSLERLERPADEISYEMMDGLAGGCKLAEQVYELADSGDWKGRLTLRAIKPKPRQAFSWVVDRFMNVLGIRADYGPDGTPTLLPREKFAAFIWMPRDGDPRGTALIRPVYDWWNLKVNLMPEVYAFSQTLAKPKAFVTVPRAAPAVAAAVIPGWTEPRPPNYLELMAYQLANSADMEFLIATEGTTYEVKGPGSGGDVYQAMIDLADRQIASGILGATRMTEEAQHGSKADSQTAQDTVGLRVRRVKSVLVRMWEWDVLYRLVLYNWGKDAADRFTPRVGLGQTEHQDFAATAAAYASWATAGLLSPNQFPFVYRDCGKGDMPPYQEPEPPPQLATPGLGPDGESPLPGQQPGPPGESPPAAPSKAA